MAQELGRIQRPLAESFKGKRKLLLVPTIYGPPVDEEEAVKILDKYWVQVQSHVASMEISLGQIKHVYHQALTEGGPEGLQLLEKVDPKSHGFVKERCEAGATLEPTEDGHLLAKALDLQRCLTIPLTSEKVVRQLHDWFSESTRQRYEYIASQIDQTLGEDESGLLLIHERHGVQFPQDMEVFHVAPPPLDEYRRWTQDWLSRQQQSDPTATEEPEDPAES